MSRVQEKVAHSARVCAALLSATLLLSVLGAADAGQVGFTATLYADMIRFAANGVASLQVAVFDLAENELWGSELVSSNHIDWDRTNEQGERLANGYYLYIAQGWDADDQLVLNKTGKIVLLPGDQVELRSAPVVGQVAINPPELERDDPNLSPMAWTVNDSITSTETAGASNFLSVRAGSSASRAGFLLTQYGSGHSGDQASFTLRTDDKQVALFSVYDSSATTWHPAFEYKYLQNEFGFAGNDVVNIGRLGIGSTSTSRALHVVGDWSGDGVLLENASAPTICIHNESIDQTWAMLVEDGSGKFIISDPSLGNNQRVWIDLQGNVGIGEPNPQSKLTVAGVVESSVGGFRFPDGSIQTSAALGGGGSGWSLTGNVGTAPGTNFLGTTDNVAFEVRVNNQRGLRIEPDATSPNLIGGYPGNVVSAGVKGATISGGGTSGQINQVSDDYGTVGGGAGNVAGEFGSCTVGGGWHNTATGGSATVAGGDFNTATGYAASVGGGTSNAASGSISAIGGGQSNVATSWGASVGGGNENTASESYATVVGGNANTASGYASTVAGGDSNTASGSYSFVVGRKATNSNADHDGVFIFADSTDATFSSTGPDQFLIRASGNVGINTNDPGSALTVAGRIETTTGGIKFPDGSIQTSAAAGGGGSGWSLTGNVGTTPGTNFIGTTDSQALQLHVNGARALRIEPHGTSPNLIGGYSGNTVGDSIYGATIAGGGTSGNINQVTDRYGAIGGGYGSTAGYLSTVGGGFSHTASGNMATVGGGTMNTASGAVATVGGGQSNEASAWGATVAGGNGNIASYGSATVGGGNANTASYQQATVSGGYQNTASGYSSTVSGGQGNTASGQGSTVGGGFENTAAGWYSFVVGHRAKNTNPAHFGVFIFADSTDADFSSTARDQFLIRASGNVGINTNNPGSTLTVAGIVESATGGFKFPDGTIQTTAYTGGGGGTTGWALTGNSITTGQFLGTTNSEALELKVDDERALRIEPETTCPNLIGGYYGNTVSAGVHGATVGGGGNSVTVNQVTDDFGTVSGGVGNVAGTTGAVGGGWQNWANGASSAVAGGEYNAANGYAAAVGGGRSNAASGEYSFAVGKDNTASGDHAAVSGGMSNEATAAGATVGGGYYNLSSGESSTVGGGNGNTASNLGALVSGGLANTATGLAATVGGGYYNEAAGDYSFVAGMQAKNSNASHDGVFIFADSWGSDLTSTTADQFNVRASGGYRLFSNGSMTTGVRLNSGSNSWSVISDRNVKENFSTVDTVELLDVLDRMPVLTWNLQAQSDEMRHIGPVAQDFNECFGYLFDEVESHVHIHVMDALGISLAASQGLYRLVQDQAEEIARLTTENTHQDQKIEELEARLGELERMMQGLKPQT